MRLLDAVRGGNLVVPKDIVKVEADLKKEWKKKDREARAALKGAAAGAGEKKKTPASRKRKNAADADADGDGSAAQAKGAKKTKAAESKTTPKTTTATATAKSTKTAAQSEPKAKAAKPAESKAKKADKASTGSTAAKKTAAKKTDEPSKAPARGTGRGGASSGRKKADPAKDKDEDEEKTEARPPRTKQTARRSRPFNPAFVGRRPMAPPVEEDHYDPMDIDEPESESELKSEDSPSDPDTQAHGSLGLVNGEYEIFSQDLNEWSEYPEDEFNLILSLAGSEMWGAYDFGMFSGIMRLPERPYYASNEKIAFEWRGRNNSEGEVSFGPDNTGWIRFLGKGKIDGQIERLYGQGRFSGRRISGQDTKPPRDVMSMSREWRGYNATEYENEQRRRWGGCQTPSVYRLAEVIGCRLIAVYNIASGRSSGLG